VGGGLTVPICICRTRARRVETHVRARMRISRESYEGSADVSIHGPRVPDRSRMGSQVQTQVAAERDVAGHPRPRARYPKRGSPSPIPLQCTRHHTPRVTHKNRVKIQAGAQRVRTVPCNPYAELTVPQVKIA
jgi:hypothetical protein